MFRFINEISNKYNVENNYHAVHKWSVTNTSDFWSEIWNTTGIIYSKPWNRIVDDPKKMPGAKWFKGALLNFAENLLRKKDDSKAIIFVGEDVVYKELTYAELYEQVRRMAAAMRKMGVKSGDRIAAFIPNIPEAIIAMLATVSIGAIWSSTSPDFGIAGVLDRFSQIQPKIIFAADGYFYKGKKFDTQEKLKGILNGLPTVEKVVLINYTGSAETQNISKTVLWDDFAVETDKVLVFEQLPFDHPLYIMYSSGTTGLPKSIVHSAGGTLIQHLKELRLHCNITSNDTVFYFTTCGWMMWNWIVSSLAIGSKLVLYDGNPFYPQADALLQMADNLKITFFGTSAKYIASLEAAGVKPSRISDFNDLKVIASTGSPLSNESFRYVYSQWNKDVQLSSIAGGTDIISCFVLGNPVLPVYEGEIQCRGLGMDVECVDYQGNTIIEDQGELVCKTAFPSMPIYFWNDVGNERYKSAYFEEFPGIWHHGDFIEITKYGGVKMLGRSDATLNPQGVRIGTAELYRVIENITEIEDSVVVGHKIDGDEEVVLFVKMAKNQQLSDALIQEIKIAIRTNCSQRHVPALIKQVPDIPYTINGKKVEVAVKKILLGKNVLNKDALANPESLEYFEGIL